MLSLLLLQSVWAQSTSEAETQTEAAAEVQAGPSHVFYAGFEPGVAVEQAAAATGLPASAMRPTSLAELRLQSDPVLSGPGDVQTCQGIASTMSNVRGATQRAENAVAYMEFENARVHLKTAMMALSCLEEPLEPESAGRIYYLEGVVREAEGSPEDATAAFEAARTFDPDMAWDSYFPPNSKPLFEAVFSEEDMETTSSLSIVPTPAEGTLWIDGQAVSEISGAMALRPGIHAIQIVSSQVNTAYVELEAGTQTSLVLPASIPDSAITWVSENKSRGDFSAILGVLLPAGSRVLVVTGGQVWIGQAGSTNWEARSIPSKLNTRRSAAEQRRLASQSLFWGGGGIALASGAFAGVSYIRARDALSAGETAAGFEAYSSARSQYMSSATRYTLSGSIALSGMVLSGIGWWIRRDEGFEPVARWDAWGSNEALGLTWTTEIR